MRKGKCVVEGCTRTNIKAYGLCIAHYQQWKRGKIDDSVIVRKPKVCTVEGCERPVVGNGLCSAHWQRRKRNVSDEEMHAPIKVVEGMAQRPCRVEGCQNFQGRHGGCGMCATHYRRWRRKQAWEIVIAMKGGKCQRCGGVFPYTVYDLHHRDPSQKDFGISLKMENVSQKAWLHEAEKCDLLCANCHRKEHFGDGSDLP